MNTITINAYSLEEAKSIALEKGFTTVTVKKSVEESDIKDGEAIIVVKEAGKADDRKRPYELVNTPATAGGKKTRLFEVRTVSDKFVCEAEKKAEAEKLAKSLMATFKEDMICRVVYKMDAEHSTAFQLKYAPSTNTKLGEYLLCY